MNWNLKIIESHLRDHDIKPSLLRLKVFEYMALNKNHPTVDMIYSALAEDIPTLSKTSIYNTLHLFTEKNVIQALTIKENEMRYDADTSTHGHFTCKVCGNVYDFDVNNANFEHGLQGFSADEVHIYLKGLCKNCNPASI